MLIVSVIAASLFVLYVLLLRPWLRRRQYKGFARNVSVSPELRSRYYLKTVSTLWTWFILIGVILQIGSISPAALGLRLPDDWNLTLIFTGELVVLLPITTLILVRRVKKTGKPGLAKLLVEVKELLPHTPRERRLWLLVSLSAGICEEILFRGFLPWYVLTLSSLLGHPISLLPAFVLSSILFGLAHTYQGWKGVLATGLLGGLLAYLYVSTGSLLLPIICHTLIDARIVFFAPALLHLEHGKKG